MITNDVTVEGCILDLETVDSIRDMRNIFLNI